MNTYKAMLKVLSGFRDVNVTVVGDIMLDRYLWGEATRISPEAPVPVVKVKHKTETLGGAGNVAVNLAGLGCRATVIGLCGDGEDGIRLKKLLLRTGSRDRIIIDPFRPTITKTRVMAGKQQTLRLDEEVIGAPDETVQTEILISLKDALSGCGAVVLSDYGKSMFVSDRFTKAVIDQCRDANVPVFVDPKGRLWEKYENADCITPNADEFQLVTGVDPDAGEQAFFSAAKALSRRLNIGQLLVTRGPKGMNLFGAASHPVVIPAKAREVFDVSGAGDTVIATMAAAVASGLSCSDSAEMANIAAGIVVGRIGTQPILKNDLALAIEQSDPDRAGIAGAVVSDLSRAGEIAGSWRAQGEKIIFTNGCFDLLHPGHISLLNQSKALGSKLIVGLNTDASVKRLKGSDRPILSEQDRAAILSALESVDLVALFGEDTPIELIKAVKPDVLVKGSDYRKEQVVGRDVVESYGGRVHLVDIVKGHSTTGIADKIKNHQ